MKHLIFIFAILYGSSVAFSQQYMRALNPNDNNYIRIVNGIITTDNCSLDKLSIIHVYDEDKKKALGFKGNQNLMIVNSVNYPIEDILFEKVRDQYLSGPYPSCLKFPIILNGELLTGERREKTLDTLQEKNIGKVVLLDKDAVKSHYPNAPFGAISVTSY